MSWRQWENRRRRRYAMAWKDVTPGCRLRRSCTDPLVSYCFWIPAPREILPAERERPAANLVDCKSVFPHEHFCRSRRAEALDAEDISANSDIAVPSLRRSHFD